MVNNLCQTNKALRKTPFNGKSKIDIPWVQCKARTNGLGRTDPFTDFRNEAHIVLPSSLRRHTTWNRIHIFKEHLWQGIPQQCESRLYCSIALCLSSNTFIQFVKNCIVVCDPGCWFLYRRAQGMWKAVGKVFRLQFQFNTNAHCGKYFTLPSTRSKSSSLGPLRRAR